jgi:hypothetical protein
LIVNRDCELFGFGQVGTSCLLMKDYTSSDAAFAGP